jgi:hypothetical protein
MNASSNLQDKAQNTVLPPPPDAVSRGVTDNNRYDRGPVTCETTRRTSPGPPQPFVVLEQHLA